MVFRVVWSNQAIREFQTILMPIHADNPTAAVRLRTLVRDQTQRLTTQPFLGAYYREISGLKIRECLQMPCRIFYSVDEVKETIEIVSVRHVSRDEPRL